MNFYALNQARNTPYPIWTFTCYVPKPTATFDKQGGTGGTNSVLVDYSVANPTITPPTRAGGYVFDGYYTGTNGTGTKYYNANGTSAANWNECGGKTLYAKWLVTVSFDANGGTGSMEAQTLENIAVLRPNTFTKDGYVFKGWSTSAGGEVEYDDGDAITATSTPVTLYAQWEEVQTEEAAVSFTHNYLKGHQAASNYNTNNFTSMSYTTSNSDWMMPANYSHTYAPTLSPYYQVCCQRYNHGYWAGDLVDWFTTTYTVPSYSSVTFTVDWCVQAAKQYSDTRSCARAAFFDYGTDDNNYWSSRTNSPSGSTGYKTALGTKFGAGGADTYTTGTYTYYGENAAVWIYQVTNSKTSVSQSATVDNSEGSQSKSENRYGAFSSSKSVTSGNATFPHHTHLKAKIGDIVYTYYKIVSFDANGGTGAAMKPQKIGTVQTDNPEATALSANTYIQTGMKFAGWNTLADGTGTSYDDCSTAVTASALDKGPVTLYAQWEEKVTKETDNTTGETEISLDEHVSTEDVVYSLNQLGDETNTISTMDMSGAEDITGDPSDIIDIIRNNSKSTPNTLIYFPADTEVPLDKSENVIVKQGDDSYKCVNFSVTDGTPVSVPHDFTADAATYTRLGSSRWGTICVPFELTSNDRIQFYTSGTSYDGTLVLDKAATVAAGKPAIYCIGGIEGDNKENFDVTYYTKSVIAEEASESGNAQTIKLVGTFKELVIDDSNAGNLGSGCDIYYYLGNNFYKRASGQTVTIPALRAYILIEKKAE